MEEMNIYIYLSIYLSISTYIYNIYIYIFVYNKDTFFKRIKYFPSVLNLNKI